MLTLIKEHTVFLIVSKNFCGALDALERTSQIHKFYGLTMWYTYLASYFVNNIPIHRHGRRFVHTTDLGDNSSEGHGWHFEWI